ncbi:MliC family protein [Segnochrobactraceae bacterium EtOH-i3]
MRATVMCRAVLGSGIGVLMAVAGIPAARAQEAAAPDAVQSAAYSCESGRQIRALYNSAANPDPAFPAAQLIIDGQVYTFYQIRSADGARYGTEQGFEPDKGLQWWTKGEDATLYEMTMDTANPEPRIIDNCTAVPDSMPGMEMEDDSDGEDAAPLDDGPAAPAPETPAKQQ